MLREIAIHTYLLIFRLVFMFFKLFPSKEKTIFITYFGLNALYTIESLEKHTNEPLIIIKGKHTHVDFEEFGTRKVIDLTKFSLYRWFSFVYELATSNKIIVDNYYGFLSVTNFKKGTMCVQLWHAVGAIKKFGLEDHSLQFRSRIAINRFKKVYNRFDRIIIGSNEMGNIYKECFGIKEDRLWRTGIPRTDFFFNKTHMQKIKDSLIEEYPLLSQKKVILYAPTFRETTKELSEIPFNIKDMHESLGDDYVILLKTHPLVKCQIQTEYQDFIINMSDYPNVNHLLVVTDILISDYSSVPFEFSLLERPMLFYAYDLDSYTKERGVWGDYDSLVPGPVVKNTSEIIDVIQCQRFNMDAVTEFKDKWNCFSTGKSSDKLVQQLLSAQK